jgi:hypothetical protein
MKEVIPCADAESAASVGTPRKSAKYHSSAQGQATFALAILVSLLAGCATPPQGQANTSGDNAELYQRAITDSAIASSEKIRPLIAIPAADTVGVVAWVSASSQFCDAGESSCQYKVGASGMFVTLDPEVQNKCRSWGFSGSPLRERLEQLLGLPPNQPVQYQKSRFVVLDVPSGRLQRPCVGLGDDVEGHPTCSIHVKASSAVSPLDFVGGQMAESYIAAASGPPGYPFTRLGYTYDWSPTSTDRYGASEFILMPGTVATVVKQASTDAFCASANLVNAK